MLDGELTFHLDGRFIFRRAEYQCSPWRGNVPVHPGYRTSSSVVGYLYRGGRANWFCRSASARSLAWDTVFKPRL